LLKHPKTIKEQVSLLKKRGIIIDDISNVESTLINNNYYRIMGYALQFRIGKEDYIKNIKFSTIVKIYNFDRSLRQIIFPLLEVFETSFRAKLAFLKMQNCISILSVQ